MKDLDKGWGNIGYHAINLSAVYRLAFFLCPLSFSFLFCAFGFFFDFDKLNGTKLKSVYILM